MFDKKQLSQERFGKFSRGYVTSAIHGKGADLQRLLVIAKAQPTWQMLDIATGGGHTALLFAPHVAHVTVTDITPRMLENAQQHLTEKGVTNANYQIADAENLPFNDDRFDFVTCRIAPHHFPDCAKFVREVARVLKPGGLFLLQDQLLPEDTASAAVIDGFEKLRDPSHHEAYATSAWLAMFESADLQVTHQEEYTKRQNFIHWAQMQGSDDATISQLTQMVENAPDAVQAWMQPENWGQPDASFRQVNLIIAGRKPLA